MAARIRITCRHDAPDDWEWASELNKKGRSPIGVIDGWEYPLSWDEPAVIEVAAGEPHQVHAFFEVLGRLRWGAADLDLPPLRQGETARLEYLVSISDRYLNGAQLRRLA